MTTEEREETEQENNLSPLVNGTQELAALHARIAPHFRRAEVRERARRFLEGLLGRVERKNGWQLAEELGECGPQGVQRLLNAADWDEEAVRDELRGYVMEYLEEEHGMLVIEVGGLRSAVDREFAALEPHWLHTEDGSDCVVLFQAARL